MSIDMLSGTVIIIGGGQGGFQVAASLRSEKFQGSIVIIGEEPGLPYQRPPLSKAYMLGKSSVADLHFRPESFFADNRIRLIHDRCVAIDREERVVTLADGRALSYDHLVLATGSRNRPLPLPGAGLANVFDIKTLAHADAIGGVLKDAHDVVVIGAGFIGLEFAAVARSLGKNVHVLELADRPMARAVSPEMSAFFTAEHERQGCTLSFRQQVVDLEGADGRVSGVNLKDSRRLPADLVVYGVGVLPNEELAAEVGLPTDNGILVDSDLLTGDSSISAIGDCARFRAADGRSMRIESVQNAADHARTVAARLVGKPAPYGALPWFWSDQYDLKLQMVGLSEGYDSAVTIGDPQDRSFTRLLFRDGRLIATESVNRPSDFMAARKVLAGSAALTLGEAQREDFDLRAWAMASARTG